MVRNYSGEGATLTPAEIDDETALQMARIIRAVAEVENLIIFYFMSLSGFNESQALAVIGQNQISTNISKCGDLADIKGQSFKVAHDATFNDAWRDVLFIRNVIAHAHLLGMTEKGDLAFRVLRDPLKNESAKTVFNVICYPPSAFKQWADIASTVAPAMLNNHQLEPWLRTSPRLKLAPHPKAQKQTGGRK